MQDVLIGAVAGAVVGWPGLYLQARLSRKADARRRSSEAVAATLTHAQGVEDYVDGVFRTMRRHLQADEFNELQRLARSIETHGMLVADRRLRKTIARSTNLLGRTGEAHLGGHTQSAGGIALTAVRHIVTCCQAYLREDRIPPDPEEFSQYEAAVDRFYDEVQRSEPTE
jgi:hypothetical protein